MSKTALITGITGQAGSYAAELLLEKNYKVVGIKRRSSTNTNERISHLLNNPNLKLEEGELCDSSSINSLVMKYKPDELYHYAAQSHVHTSFEQPHYTAQVNINGTLNILEAVRVFSPGTRVLNSSTSEMFGSNYNTTHITEFEPSTKTYETYEHKTQSEDTVFHPRSPYAAAKVAAHYLVQNYREAYGLHASSSITFNFESPRRGENFVTRKITKWIGEFVKWRHPIFEQGQYVEQDWDNRLYNSLVDGIGFAKLRLGNINSFRDWTHCKDTVYAQWLMLQQDQPEDFVISSMQTYSVAEFLKRAFKVVGIDDWQHYVVISQEFFRPSEVEYLCGDSTRIRTKLGWKPKYSFDDLVKEMVESDCERT